MLDEHKRIIYGFIWKAVRAMCVQGNEAGTVGGLKRYVDFFSVKEREADKWQDEEMEG